MKISKGELVSFNSGDYTATVRIAGGYKDYLEDINVARNLSSAEMAIGCSVAVIFFEDNRPRDAVIVAVFS